MTRLDVPVTFNFRPVAGTRPGTLYRSDALAKVNRAGRQRLRELGVRRVIDLRSDLDRRLSGPDRIRGVGAELVKAPMLSGGSKKEIYGLTLEGIYRQLLDSNGRALGAAIRAVAEAPEGSVVVHCTAGKDRSGVTAALIQLAIGVDEATVLDDFARTEGNLAGPWATGMLARMRKLRIEVTPQLERVFVGSPPEAMAATLQHLRDAHDGGSAYLSSIGVTEAHRERLRMQLAG